MPGRTISFITALTSVVVAERSAVQPFGTTDTLGDMRYEGHNGYRYVAVRNVTATVAGIAGDPVAYSSVSTSARDGFVVTDLTDADAVPVFAGLFQAAVAGLTTKDYYCWIQVSGEAFSNPAIAGTVGQHFKLSTTDKTWAAIAAFTDSIAGINKNTAARRVVVLGSIR